MYLEDQIASIKEENKILFIKMHSVEEALDRLAASINKLETTINEATADILTSLNQLLTTNHQPPAEPPK